MHAETPKHNHAPIAMTPQKDGFDGINNLGDFCISEDGARIQLAIPSTRPFLQKEKGWTYIDLRIYAAGTPKPEPVAWEWDGNREKPTLSPSIWTHGHWHGWVRNGEMIEA